MFIELTEVSQNNNKNNSLLLALSDIRAIRPADTRTNAETEARTTVSLYSGKSVDVKESIDFFKKILSEAKMLFKNEKDIEY